MQRYSGNKLLQGQWLFFILLYVSIVVMAFFALADARSHRQPMYFDMALAAIVLFSFMGGLSVYVFLDSLTVYEADDSEIVQSRFFRTRRMRWRDVVELQEGRRNQQSDITLIDNGGKKLGIQLGSLGNQGAVLYGLITSRLAALRARQVDEFAAQEQSLAAAPSSVIVMLTAIGALFIAGSVGVFQFDAYLFHVPSAGMLLSGILILVVRCYFGDRRVTFSGQEIRERLFWHEKRLPLRKVESVFLYQDAAKNNGFETITLRGNGTQMQFACTMPDYPLLRAAILSNVPAEAIQRGERDRAAYDRLQTRLAVICLSVCCASMVAFAAWGLYKELTDDQRIDRLARNGVYTTALVTGNDYGYSNRDLKVVEYAFTVDGKSYTGENRLTDSNARIRVNDTVQVCYLPQNPSENRLKVLLDWRRSLLHSVLLTVPLLATPLLIPGFLWMKKRNQQRSTAPV